MNSLFPYTLDLEAALTLQPRFALAADRFSLLAHSACGFDLSNVGGGEWHLAGGVAHIH
jgi:hypothetical protein